jgi:hypothetical protein
MLTLTVTSCQSVFRKGSTTRRLSSQGPIVSLVVESVNMTTVQESWNIQTPGFAFKQFLENPLGGYLGRSDLGSVSSELKLKNPNARDGLPINDGGLELPLARRLQSLVGKIFTWSARIEGCV